MRLVFDAVRAAQFFDMPNELDPPTDELATFRIPFSSFELEVAADGQRHIVKGDDMTDPAGPIVKRFLDLVQLILNT